jgi:hypothetical protein
LEIKFLPSTDRLARKAIEFATVVSLTFLSWQHSFPTPQQRPDQESHQMVSTGGRDDSQAAAAAHAK